MTPTIYRGHILTPVRRGGWRDLQDARLEVSAGRITAVGPWRKASRYIDLRPHILFPGFVDTHAHVPQLSVCGLHPENLLSWLKRWIFPLEQKFRGARARLLSKQFISEMLSHGTTTAALYTSAWPDSVTACFEAAREAGIHAWIGQPLMDIHPYRTVTTRKLLREIEELLPLDGSERRLAITPRFALSCSDELMEAAAAIARAHDLPIQTHLAEQEPECREVRRRFRRSYTEVYERMGLISPRTLFAHCIWMNRVDWSRLGDAAVAHCPGSNVFLGSGVMDWNSAKRLRLGLGSDVGAGPDLSIPRTARTAWTVHSLQGRNIPAGDLLRAATLGGAEALGFEDIGSLEAGTCADFIVFDRDKIVPPGAPALESTNDLLSRVLHRAGRSSIRAVYVKGRLP